MPRRRECEAVARESVILPAWTTAAILVSLLPDGANACQDHLQMIWDLETTGGINYCALAAIHSRARRQQPRPSSQPDETTAQEQERPEKAQRSPPVP